MAADAQTDAADSPRRAAPGARARRWPVIGFALAAAVIVIDQISKAMALRAFGPEVFDEDCRASGICRHFELSHIFDLSMVWNRGVSFGMMKAESGIGRWSLVIFSALVAAGLAWWLSRARRPAAAIGLALIIGGALGNMIDRARFGAVVDFLDFSGLYFPWVFNVADAAINVGAALILLEVLLDRRPHR